MEPPDVGSGTSSSYFIGVSLVHGEPLTTEVVKVEIVHELLSSEVSALIGTVSHRRSQKGSKRAKFDNHPSLIF